MNKPDLKKMTVEQLVDLFRGYALEQDYAMLGGEQKKVNRLFWQLNAVEDELKSRQGDQRSALLRLYGDENSQVKVKAMKATLAVAPSEAKAGLSKLRENKLDPVCLEAGMSLWAIEQGISKPT